MDKSQGASGFSNGNWDNIVLLCRSERVSLCVLTQMNTDEHVCLAQGAKVQKALWNICTTPHHSMEGGNTYKSDGGRRGNLKDLLFKCLFCKTRIRVPLYFQSSIYRFQVRFSPSQRAQQSTVVNTEFKGDPLLSQGL